MKTAGDRGDVARASSPCALTKQKNTGWKPVPHALVLLLVFWFTSKANAQSATTKPTPVVLPASIEAFEIADQYAKTSGYISEVKSDIGDHVKKGQVLAVIYDPELEQDVAEAKAIVESKQQLLTAAEASVEQAKKMIDVAKSQLASAQAEHELADITLKRQEELFSGKAITEQQLDDIKARATTAQANVAVAQAKIAAAEADLTSAQANRGVAAAQVDVAKASLTKAQTLLQYTSIIAPFDGVVTRRWANRGDLVQAAINNRTMPMFTCQRMDVMRIFCDVPETAAAGIHGGDAVEVKVYGLAGKTVPATITRTSSALDPQTRTMRVEVDLPNSNGQFLPGMYAQVTLTPGPAPVAEAPVH